MTAAALQSLTIRDFRNIERAEMTFGTEGIVVVGDNGHGKTNLIEAISYFRLLRSIRGARDRDLIRFGATAFHIAAEISGASALRVSAASDKAGKKKITVDGAECTRLADGLDALPSVAFSPRDVDLVAGSPAERRRYLDITLALTSAAYMRALSQYRSALARRNATLREIQRGGGRSVRGLASTIGVWDEALAQSGGVIISERRDWIKSQNDNYSARCSDIGETGRTTLDYSSPLAASDDPAQALREQLERQAEIDVRRGLTHAGPHRDDLALLLDGRDLRVVGSAGQQRTAAIVLRLLEGETHRYATGVTPLLLLDDPFAELDRRRSERILEILEGMGKGQCILCVPREDEIPERFTRLKRWRVRDGKFTMVER